MKGLLFFSTRALARQFMKQRGQKGQPVDRRDQGKTWGVPALKLN